MNWTAWAVETTKADQLEVALLVSGEVSDEELRAPVMVNVVLDRSGSMKGAPLSAAVEAAQQLIELARPDDFLGLVLFDGVVEQRVPIGPMDAKGKRQMVEGLQGVQTGRGTALYQAVELALRGVQRTLVPGRRPRLLVLTDGEPSVGPDSQEAFDHLGLKLAHDGVAVHALGLAKHYVAEVLDALTRPSGNAFEHVDGPEGLTEAMGGLVAHLFGQVATDAIVRVQPSGFSSLTCRHGYPARLEDDALIVTLGDVTRGFARRVLFTGGTTTAQWAIAAHGGSTQRGDKSDQLIDLERVEPGSPRGKMTLGIGHELELVSAETAAWLSLARKDLERAETQLEDAERHLKAIVTLEPDGIPVRRHIDRLADLRLAVERGEGDIPLLIRRAQSARAGTHVSQVIPIQAYRRK